MNNDSKDKPFHGIHTDGRFVEGYKTLKKAKKHVETWNRNARDNGRSERYLAIPNPTTLQEES